MENVFDKFGKVLPTETLYEMQTQYRGGKCMVKKCGKDFRMVRVINAVVHKDPVAGKEVREKLFADFTMYVPSCNCYKTCQWAGHTGVIYTRDGKKEIMVKAPGCGRVMVAERLLTENGNPQKTCLNCGGIIL